MAYRNLTFRALANDIRLETYLGEEHIVVPCIALVGDEVVYGLNAEGPEFIPAEELEFSTLGWSGRPVLYDHPANSTSTANEPATLQAMSFGQIFYPKFEDRKLKVEAWCNKRRAKEIGQEELMESIESGKMIELSVGAIISIVPKRGIAANGKPYESRWADIVGDHLAIGLSGSKGACSVEMGCGANRVLKSGNDTRTIGNEMRTMRAMRGAIDMNDQPEPKPEALASGDTASNADVPKPQTRIQKILSFASRVFRSNADDAGLSDRVLRNQLWDILYSIEPAFSGIEDVFQDSSTVRYITSPIVPERAMFMWRRTFAKGEGEEVTVNDDRELVSQADPYYGFLAANETTENDKPCGCHKVDAGQTVSANETNTQEESTDMADDPNKPKPDAIPPATNTTTTPATPPASNTPASTTVPATTTPDETTANPDATATSVTTEQLKALLEAHPVVKHYRAQEAKEKASLVAALTKKQTVLSKDQLDAKPIEELRTYAEFLGIGSIAQQSAPMADFSGRMMADGGDNDPAEVKVPKSWSAALKAKSGDKGDKEAN